MSNALLIELYYSVSSGRRTYWGRWLPQRGHGWTTQTSLKMKFSWVSQLVSLYTLSYCNSQYWCKLWQKFYINNELLINSIFTRNFPYMWPSTFTKQMIKLFGNIPFWPITVFCIEVLHVFKTVNYAVLSVHSMCSDLNCLSFNPRYYQFTISQLFFCILWDILLLCINFRKKAYMYKQRNAD